MISGAIDRYRGEWQRRGWERLVASRYLVLVPFLVTTMFLQNAGAATFDVDRMDDPSPPPVSACTGADNDCTLRGAIGLSNTNGGGPDVINIPAGTYSLNSALGSLVIDMDNVVTLSGAGSAIIPAATSQIVEEDPRCNDVTTTCIEGNSVPVAVGGSATTASPAGFNDRIVTIRSADVVITGVVIRGGDTYGFGGGISVEGGTLRLEDSLVTENYSMSGGGGIASVPGVINAVSATTSGVFASTSLTVVDSEISKNFAGGLGGNQILNADTADIEGSEVSGDGSFGDLAILEQMAAGTGFGTTSGLGTTSGGPIEDLLDFIYYFGLCGGIANFGEMTITESEVVNDVGIFGGGICNTPLPEEFFAEIATTSALDPPFPTDAVLTVTDSLVLGNGALLGGGIWNRAGFVSLLLLFEDLFYSETLTFGSATATLTDETDVVFNIALMGGGMMNSRSILGDLEVVCDVMDGEGAVTNAPPPMTPPALSVGTASAVIEDDSFIGYNLATVGGGVFNDQAFVPLTLYYIFDIVNSATIANTSGATPSVAEVPGNIGAVSLAVSESGIGYNFGLIGAGVASFAATSTFTDSGLAFNGDNFFFAEEPAAAALNGGLPDFYTFGGGLYNAFGSATVDGTEVFLNSAAFGSGISNLGGEGGFYAPFFTLLDFFCFAFDEGSCLAASPPLLAQETGVGDTILSVDSSTIADNGPFGETATGATSGLVSLSETEGGGLLNEYAVADLLNTTISGNATGSDGGGVANFYDGQVFLTHVTVSDNSAGASGSEGNGGGIFEASDNDTISLKNTIVAGNFDLASDDGEHPDCSNEGGTIDSLGSNLVGDDTGCDGEFSETGDQVGADPALEPLDDYGGLTSTHRLGAGSAAIDAVDDCTDQEPAPVTVDQRGFSRPQGTACDVGAYEAACGDGFLDEDAGEECDLGEENGPDDCCTDDCLLEAAEFVCRDAVGVCDAAEVCADHVDGLCPEDDKLGEETECRMSVDVCDPAEVCDGVDNDCPADVDFVDSDGDGACDGSEPETKNDPTKVMLEDPMVTVEILSGCAQLLDFAFLDEMDLSPEDEYYEYPLGLVTFALPCASAEIKITFAEAPADLGDGNFLYRVYDPDTMTYETLPGVVMMGNMVFLSLVDGGPGDTGTVEVATMGTAPDGMIAHTGGPSYSIGPVQAPALSFGALVIAVGVLMGIVWPRMRRRRGGRL